jgi:lysozyme
MTEKGLELIKYFEGCRLTAYKCPAGVWTIGYGTTQGVKPNMVITQAQAETFLKRDIKPVESVLNGMGINYTQGQFDALVAWVYNLGIGAFKSSTMYRYIVARRNDVEITDQMVRWVNAGGRPLAGLKRRRVAEANIFLGKSLYYLDMSGNIKKH